MASLVPNPVGGIIRRVDGTLETVDGVLGRVDQTLAEVKDLLTELEGELQLLHQVPEMAAKLDEIHRICRTSPPGTRTAGATA
jgi:hypothetical protein